jgi:hypothetical protein
MRHGILMPLGGGASQNDAPAVCDDHGCIARVQVLIDLWRARPTGCYFPPHCPVCTVGTPGADDWVSHTFDYVERLADGAIWVVCCNCGGEWELHAALDAAQGISVSPPVLLRPTTYRKSEAAKEAADAD